MDHSIPAIDHHHPSWLVVVLVLVLVLVLVVVDGSGRDNDMIGSLITSPDPSSVDVGCRTRLVRSDEQKGRFRVPFANSFSVARFNFNFFRYVVRSSVNYTSKRSTVFFFFLVWRRKPHLLRRREQTDPPIGGTGMNHS